MAFSYVNTTATTGGNMIFDLVPNGQLYLNNTVTMTTTTAAVVNVTSSGAAMNIQLAFDFTPKREPTDEELAETEQRWSELWE